MVRSISPRVGFGPIAHGNRGLDAEILHDHFLNVAVALVQFANSEQSINAILGRFADADQQARGERNVLFAGVLDSTQALGGNFIGSVVVGRAGSQQAESLVVSSISPMLGETAARRAIHSALSRPGLGCGSRVVSRKTSSHMASR